MNAFASTALHLVKSVDLKALSWRHHGLGMLQGELDEELRIHVWHPDLVRLPKGFRRVHDHRFTINAAVVHGLIIDQSWEVSFDIATRAPNTECWEIMHAKGQSPSVALVHPDDPGEKMRLGCSTATESTLLGKVAAKPIAERVFQAGTDYMVKRRDFHTTIVGGLAITVVHRSNFDDKLARVLGAQPSAHSAIERSTSKEEIIGYLDMARAALVQRWDEVVAS